MRLRLAVLGFWLLGCGSSNDEPGGTRPISRPGTSSDGEPDAFECPSDGWCWVRGRPFTVGGDDPSNVYAIGPAGAFMRWHADGWVSVPVPTDRWLISATVGGRGNLWAVDESGAAWHFDGAEWSEAPHDEPISRVFLRSDGTVWAQAGASFEAHGGGSSGGRLVRREDNAWVSPIQSYEYCLGGDFSMFGEEIWSAGWVCPDAVGNPRTVVHRFDGTGWEQVGHTLSAGWYPHFDVVDGRIRVNTGLVYEWDGAAWQQIETPMYPQDLPDGQRALWDGREYSTVPHSFECSTALRVDATHVWCPGAGQIYLYDGSGWRPTVEDVFAETQSADAWGTLPPALWAGADTVRAWGSGPNDVYRIRNAGSLEHFDGSAWTTVLDYRVNDVDGLNEGDVWFATEREPVHFDGNAFTPHPLPADLATESTRVHAYAPSQALLVARNRLWRFHGEWSLVRESPDHRFIHDAAVIGDEIWVVEDIVDRDNRGFLAHFDGQEWRDLEAPEVMSFGELVTAAGAVWLSTEGAVVRLGANGTTIAIDRAMTLNSLPSLWIGAEALWLTTHKQARRYDL